MPIVSNPYDGSIYPVTYTIGAVAAGQVLTSAKFIEIAVAVNSERTRRGSAANISGAIFSGAVEASDMNAMVTALTTAATPYTAGFAGVSTGGAVYASNINDMISKVVNAGAECLCNCNYCTCNCNYCTCNCNYACTCNCNYSDERVKTEIEYM